MFDKVFAGQKFHLRWPAAETVGCNGNALVLEGTSRFIPLTTVCDDGMNSWHGWWTYRFSRSLLGEYFFLLRSVNEFNCRRRLLQVFYKKGASAHLHLRHMQVVNFLHCTITVANHLDSDLQHFSSRRKLQWRESPATAICCPKRSLTTRFRTTAASAIPIHSANTEHTTVLRTAPAFPLVCSTSVVASKVRSYFAHHLFICLNGSAQYARINTIETSHAIN